MLVPNGPTPYELIDSDGQTQRFGLDASGASQLVSQAVEDAGHHGLVWDNAPIRLIPTEGLVELIRRSRDVQHTDEG